MGRISGLSDELLIKILSFLPTKVAVSTSVLSKQWEFLWTWLPKLEYIRLVRIRDSEAECKRLRCFLHRSLPLHRAPVIECLRLHFDNLHVRPEDIKMWVLTAVSRNLRELEIAYDSWPAQPDILPSSLYICKSLVTLTLNGKILVDVPRMVCLPCLKTLRLRRVLYFNDGSLHRLLSICPVLEDLLIKGRKRDDMRKLSVIPSLRRLVISIRNELVELVINTPSLKYLRLEYCNYKSHHCLIENMPKLEEAYLDVSFPHFKNSISSITNVKRLALCLDNDSVAAMYGNDLVFNELENLNLCICLEYSLNALVRLLQVSPKLRVLDLEKMQDHEKDDIVGWNQPSSVPECMLSSLETLKWSRYWGSPEERDVAIYILGNARRLKTATISSQPCLYPTLDMLKELALCSRASSKCQLYFD